MDDLVRFTLRLPPELADALKAVAERESRSLHAQIIHILRRFIEESERQGDGRGEGKLAA